MGNLNALDIAIIVLYFAILNGFGFFLKKKASRSVKDYFLGGNNLPWWAMGISGMSSFLDMAGTMLIVSFLYTMGPRGLYIEFRGGAVLILSFMLIWSGKWHYRSKCMTGAEWMRFRFGDSWGGQFARIISAVAVIISTIGMLAYLIKALGMFAAMFLPYSPAECALIMIGVATIYTVVSGFYGVVYTDLFQSFLVISAIVIIIIFTLQKISGVENIAAFTSRVTGTNDWTGSSLLWKVKMPAGYEPYQDLTLLTFFYFLRNMFVGISSAGADPKYFGARSERECGTLTFLWTTLMTLRWPMMIGFAVLGIFMTYDLIPDHTKLVQAADLIKLYIPGITRDQWPQAVASIMHAPESFRPELISGLKSILAGEWQTKLHLLSFDGTINSEKMLPAVILYYFPMGVRGLLLVAFVAAAISSFNSRVNTTTGYFTNDLYHTYIRPRASQKELLYISYVFIIFLVVIGYILAYNVHSITQIWGWIIMGLGGGLAIPGMLKFYWWRYNGEGFAIGTTVGIIVAVLLPLFFPGLFEWQQFVIVSVFSLTAAILGTLLTSPTEENIVRNFYQQTRPFGFWKKYKETLAADVRLKMEKEHKNDLRAVPFTLGWQITMFFIPMQLMIQSYHDLFVTLGIFIFSVLGMYWFWYRNLPPRNFEATEALQRNDSELKEAPINGMTIADNSISEN